MCMIHKIQTEKLYNSLLSNWTLHNKKIVVKSFWRTAILIGGEVYYRNDSRLYQHKL